MQKSLKLRKNTVAAIDKIKNIQYNVNVKAIAAIKLKRRNLNENQSGTNCIC